MWTIRKIAKAELQTLFYSPFAWLMLVLFAVVVFGQFYGLFDTLVRSQEIGDSLGNVTPRLYTGQYGYFATLLDKLFYFFPLLTMGLISREVNTGGIKLLDSSPVATRQVVFGKYLSMCLFSLLLVAILAVTVVPGILTVPHLEICAVLTAMLGLYLLMCTYAAVGLFMSSLTSYPIVAAAGTLGVLGALTYVDTIWQDVNFVREITWWLDINKRIYGMLDGLVSSADIIYYLLIIAMCVTFTCFRLKFKKMPIPWFAKAAAYAGVVVVTLGLGYVTSRPAAEFYADATTDRRNTLSDRSREIVEDVEGRVTITSYVNVLHKNVIYMLPSTYNQNIEFFERYTRFHPDIRQKYVYYYAPTDEPGTFASYRLGNGAPADSIALEFCEVNGLDTDLLLTPEQAQQLSPVDLAAENNPVIRTVEAPGGEARPLRFFNDNMVLPDEREISAAFMGLSSRLPRVVCLTGKGMPGIPSGLKEGYDAVLTTPSRRISLVNQGFEVSAVDIAAAAIPDDTDLLIVANPTEALTPRELAMLTGYIERGGNMLLLADVDNTENMNMIAAPLGVSFAEGYLVEEHAEESDLYPHIVQGRFCDGASRVDPAFEMWQRRGITQPMRMAAAIVMPEGEGYIPILASSSEGWLKRDKANLLEGGLAPDASQGEYRRSWPMLAGVERMVGDKRQRVVVSSDAEWLTNVGLATGYPGVRSAAADLALSCFGWLVDGRLPVDVERGQVDDTSIDFRDSGLGWLYYLYIWILPLSMAVTGWLLYRRRNRR